MRRTVRSISLLLAAGILMVAVGCNGDDDKSSSTPTPTAAPTTTATAVVTDGGTGVMPAFTKDASHGEWTIKVNDGIDRDPIVRDWLSRVKDPAPQLWKTYPNIPNPDVSGFRVVNGTQVPDGVEYGVANVPFCQQDSRCDIVVPAQHYRLITGNYQFLGNRCGDNEGEGCLLLLINVSEKSHTFRDQIVDNGFTVPGRYWNGDALEWGIWGLVSHASANMLNMPTMASATQVLNPGGSFTNGGANCGVPSGCKSVEATVIVIAGDRILAVATSTVTK